MSEHNITAVELARRLQTVGVAVSAQAIRNKLGRGTFPAAFFFAAIACIRGAKIRVASDDLMQRYTDDPDDTGTVREMLRALEEEGIKVEPKIAKLLKQQFK